MKPIKPLVSLGTEGWERQAEALLGMDGTDVSVPPIGNLALPRAVIEHPRDYIVVEGKNGVIAKRQNYNGLNWQTALETVARDGLLVPRIDFFMQHFLNVREAAHGRKTLVDVAGNRLSLTEAQDHWNYVSSTNRTPYNNKPFWAHLDARFKDVAGKMHLETDHRVVGGKMTHRDVLLEPYHTSNGWADLSLNKQGIPRQASATNSYAQGQNIYLYAPVNDRVAGFDAYSVRAVLYCIRDPQYSGADLGVLACAEGAIAKNS